MKNLFLAIMFLVPIAAFAQKDTTGLHIPMSNGSVVYEKIFEAPGKTKMQLFNSAQQWFIERYKTDKSIEVLDTANMRVLGKGKEMVNFIGPFNAAMTFVDRMSIQIDCKDGKYRCRMYSMTLANDDTSQMGKITTSPEEMVSIATGKSEPSGLNKKQARRVIESLNAAVNNAMMSLDKTMNDSF